MQPPPATTATLSINRHEDGRKGHPSSAAHTINPFLLRPRLHFSKKHDVQRSGTSSVYFHQKSTLWKNSSSLGQRTTHSHTHTNASTSLIVPSRSRCRCRGRRVESRGSINVEMTNRRRSRWSPSEVCSQLPQNGVKYPLAPHTSRRRSVSSLLHSLTHSRTALFRDGHTHTHTLTHNQQTLTRFSDAAGERAPPPFLSPSKLPHDDNRLHPTIVDRQPHSFSMKRHCGDFSLDATTHLAILPSGRLPHAHSRDSRSDAN